MARVVDCTLFFNEFRLLSLRLGILRDCVDHFVIAEANRTFSGETKPLRLQSWIDEHAADLAHRITVVEVTDFPQNPNPWIAETYQRNAVLRGFGNLDGGDVLMFFDVDEIPRMEQILAHLPANDIAVVEQDFYYYFLNLHRGTWSKGTVSYARNMVITPQEARTLYHRPVIKHGGWHFSYLMSAADMATKIRAFSHQEFNIPSYTDTEKIATRVAARDDLFGRKGQPKMVIRPLDDTFPAYLHLHRAQYDDMILDAGHGPP